LSIIWTSGFNQSKTNILIRCSVRADARNAAGGLFDVSLPDALRMAHAFGMLPREIKAGIMKASSEIQEKIALEGTELRDPFFPDTLSPDRIDQLAESIHDVVCPLLD
jgi:hypothetical protein